jgi:glycosyltransferase involved in cell wall biosynthesis
MGIYEERMGCPEHFVVRNEFVPYDEIQALFEEARVVVLPYTEATQSAVLSLAYAFEKPVVVTNVGGLPEMVRHGRSGFVVEPGDVDGLSAAVIRILKDEALRERMKAEIREMKQTTLSWASIARDTEKVFRLAVESHGSGRGRARSDTAIS